MAQRVLFGVFVACLFGSLFYLVHPWYDLTTDGSIFIITARSIAAGEGYRYLGDPFQVRPPGFPLLILPFVGGLQQDFFTINFFMGCFGAAGVVLLFWHARPRLGFGLALLTAAAIWLNPNYQRLSTQVMSDVPGTTLLLLCLLAERWASAKPSPRREIVLGLAIGLSTYVRTITILLVPAILLSRLLRPGAPGARAWTPSLAARRLLLFAGVAALVLIPWSIRNQRNPAPSPSEQTYLYSYSVANLHVDPGDPDSPRLPWHAILERIPLRASQIAYVLGSRLGEEIFPREDPRGRFGTTDSAIALVMLGSSLLLLAKRREPAEFFVVGVVAVTATYFAFATRLVLPLFVLSLPAAAEVVRDLVARGAGRRAGASVVAAVLLVLIGIDYSPRRNWDLIEQQDRKYRELSRAVEGAVGPDARLGAVIGAFHYSVFLDRPVYSVLVVLRRANRPEAADALIQKHGIDTFVLSRRRPSDMLYAEYLERRYGEPEQVGPVLIFRIPPGGSPGLAPAPSR